MTLTANSEVRVTGIFLKQVALRESLMSVFYSRDCRFEESWGKKVMLAWSKLSGERSEESNGQRVKAPASGL